MVLAQVIFVIMSTIHKISFLSTLYVGDEFHSLIDIIPWKACLEPAV
jgi:hypothetical protein